MNRIETAYSDIDVRVYLLFVNEDALKHAIGQCMLTVEERLVVLEHAQVCSYNGTARHTLVVTRKPGKKIPRAYSEMAREIFEQWPLEHSIQQTKNASGLMYADSGIREFGNDLPVYTGKLHNF